MTDTKKERQNAFREKVKDLINKYPDIPDGMLNHVFSVEVNKRGDAFNVIKER